MWCIITMCYYRVGTSKRLWYAVWSLWKSAASKMYRPALPPSTGLRHQDVLAPKPLPEDGESYGWVGGCREWGRQRRENSIFSSTEALENRCTRGKASPSERKKPHHVSAANLLLPPSLAVNSYIMSIQQSHICHGSELFFVTPVWLEWFAAGDCFSFPKNLSGWPRLL